jgi:hypothetical protein
MKNSRHHNGESSLVKVVSLVVASCLVSCTAYAQTVVSDADGFQRAVGNAKPGDVVLLAPGDYPGGFYFQDLHGEPDRPIVIASRDPSNPARFVGGATAIHLAGAAHVELRDFVVTGATANGLNLDDQGSIQKAAHHLALRRLTVTNVGPEGNRDGVKMSGVDDFTIEDCRVSDWGSDGSGIDMVGCHRGLIRGNRFGGAMNRGSEGVQMKGGSSEIVVRQNRFENAGQRAVNIGGSTGLEYFRPPLASWTRPYSEAWGITVEGNLFVGSAAPVAFVGVDGAVVRFNTIYRPKRWALRILQQTLADGFVPSRNGVFASNLVVFRSDEWASGGINIGPATAPETFRFEQNAWYCLDRPEASRPNLPMPEANGIYGVEPVFVEAGQDAYTQSETSPTRSVGRDGFTKEPPRHE